MVVIVDPCGCLGDDPAYFIATLSKYVAHKATVYPYFLECVTIVYMSSTLCVQDGVDGGFGSVNVLLNALDDHCSSVSSLCWWDRWIF